MESNNSKEKVVVDIESGGNASGEDETITCPNSGKKQGKKSRSKSLNKLASRVLSLNASLTKDEHETSINVARNPESLVDDSHERVELLIDKGQCGQQGNEVLPLIEKKHEKERRKTGKSKKAAAKPPRPPKGPFLDAADMKLVREISEHATKKRERIERMKALKKLKATKKTSPSSTSTSTISAFIVTILFFLALIFQGLSSRRSLIDSLPGAPEPAFETQSLISVELFNHTDQKSKTSG